MGWCKEEDKWEWVLGNVLYQRSVWIGEQVSMELHLVADVIRSDIWEFVNDADGPRIFNGIWCGLILVVGV